MNPSLDPLCKVGGFTPWLMRQGSVEASTCGCDDASLLVHQLYCPLLLADSLGMVARFLLAVILSADKALSDLDTFAFLRRTSSLRSGATRLPSPCSASFRGSRSSKPSCRGCYHPLTSPQHFFMMCRSGGTSTLIGVWQHHIPRGCRRWGASSSSPLDQSWLIWREAATLVWSSQYPWKNSLQEGDHRAEVPPKAAAAAPMEAS